MNLNMRFECAVRSEVLWINDRGIDALGIWVQVPHYVSTMPYPAGTLALLSGLREVAEIEIDSTGLATETADQRIKLDQLVSGNDEHRAMVQQLEEIYDNDNYFNKLSAPVKNPLKQWIYTRQIYQSIDSILI